MNTMLGNQSPEKGTGIWSPSRSKTIVIEEEPRAVPQAWGALLVPMGGEKSKRWTTPSLENDAGAGLRGKGE